MKRRNTTLLKKPNLEKQAAVKRDGIEAEIEQLVSQDKSRLAHLIIQRKRLSIRKLEHPWMYASTLGED